MKDKIIDEKVVVNIDTPEGRKFYEDIEGENYILFSGGRAKGKTYILKKLQALEIIKEKGCIALDVDYENYNEWKKHHAAFVDIDTGEFPLTQEEFDLLKEILNNV